MQPHPSWRPPPELKTGRFQSPTSDDSGDRVLNTDVRHGSSDRYPQVVKNGSGCLVSIKNRPGRSSPALIARRKRRKYHQIHARAHRNLRDEACLCSGVLYAHRCNPMRTLDARLKTARHIRRTTTPLAQHSLVPSLEDAFSPHCQS